MVQKSLAIQKGHRGAASSASRPVGMPDSQFKDAQDRYVAKFDKLVKPSQTIAVEAAKAAADFGKTVINYMVIGNAGGLGALIVVAPLVPDKSWLAHQFWPAAAFALGTSLGVVIAVTAHFNYASHAKFYFDQARRDTEWLKSVEFEFDKDWRAATDKWLAAEQATASRRANISNIFSVLIFTASAICWSYGALSLTTSLIAAFSRILGK